MTATSRLCGLEASLYTTRLPEEHLSVTGWSFHRPQPNSNRLHEVLKMGLSADQLQLGYDQKCIQDCTHASDVHSSKSLLDRFFISRLPGRFSCKIPTQT